MGLGVLLALSAFFLIKSGKEAIQETLFEGIIPGAGLMLQDIHFAQNNPEKGMSWALDAKSMKSSGDKNAISFNGFRLKITLKDGAFFELTGGKGNYARETGEINLWEDLEGVSGNGYRVETDHMLINEKSGLLSTDKPIKIFGPFFSVEGRGLLVDSEKETLKILSNVTAVIDMEPLS